MRDDDEDVRPYHLYGATLRIMGTLEGTDAPEAITTALALSPTYTHRRGDRPAPGARPYPTDTWQYEAPLPREEPLDKHMLALWDALHEHASYLKALKTRQRVDIYCEYRTNVHSTGVVVDYRALELCRLLELPFGLSILVPCHHLLGLAQE
jgi:hypothetical protein